MIRELFSKPVATVAFSMRPARGAWGGSSAFVAQLAPVLRRRGYRVCYDLRGDVDLIVIIDPRTDNRLKVFGTDEITAYRRAHPRVRVLHRVNECDQRKATTFMDPLLAEANKNADHTTFIAEWLRDYHTARWFDAARPHSVIYNGADPAIFHPIGATTWKPGEPFRLVTHHWSDNPLKGFDVYEQVDAWIADGKLPGFEFWVVGRWPQNIRWRAAKTIAPLSGNALASVLRQCHGYLTASRWEPCGMHHIEGAQCGLPLAAHRDGGGIVEAAERYGVLFGDDYLERLVGFRERYTALRPQLFAQFPSGDRMTLSFADLIQQMIATRD